LAGNASAVGSGDLAPAEVKKPSGLETRTPSFTDGERSRLGQDPVSAYLSNAMFPGETDDEWDGNPALNTPVQEKEPELDQTLPQSFEPSRLSMRELSLQYLQRPAIIFANIDLFR